MANQNLLEKKLFASGHVSASNKKNTIWNKSQVVSILKIFSVNKKKRK